MCSGAELQLLLLGVLDHLEAGDWRAVLRPGGLTARRVAGPGHLVRFGSALTLVALSMQMQAQGNVQEASNRVDDAAEFLPAQLRWVDETGAVRPALVPNLPDDAPVDERLVRRLTRLCWREKAELEYLRDTLAPEATTARDELAEAMIQHWVWVQFDRTTFLRDGRPVSTWNDGVSVECSRTALCTRASKLRHFANPRRGCAVSQSPWRDVGALRGLYGTALARFGGHNAAAPWCGTPGTSDLPVRLGRLRAWQHAQP